MSRITRILLLIILVILLIILVILLVILVAYHPWRLVCNTAPSWPVGAGQSPQGQVRRGALVAPTSSDQAGSPKRVGHQGHSGLLLGRGDKQPG